MEISGIKINGIVEPVGYQFEPLFVSWVVSQTKGKKQQSAKIMIATTSNFSEVKWEKEGNLVSTGTKIDLSLEPRTVYFLKISVTDEHGNIGEGMSRFETGKMDEEWEAEWIGVPEDYPYHPIIMKEFLLEKTLKQAKLYISGLGLYEVSLNGRKVGDEVLTPFFNDYRSQIQTQTYDITDYINLAENNIEILLGNGWYKGRFGLESQENYFGNQFAAIAELHLTYDDGTRQVVGTDLSWSYKASHILKSGIYDGETIDECYWDNRPNEKQAVMLVDIDQSLLKERISPPLKVQETLSVKQVIKNAKGETILDMGQNLAGWITFEADFPKGTTIQLDFGEILQEDQFYNDNYGSATSGFTYVSNGQKKTVRPHFTYFGFRYVRVTGWPANIGFENIRARVIHSDLQRTGFIETGHKKLNRLYKNTLWSQKSNFIDMPTDCPQRSERLGWTGDAQVYAPTASYHMDTRAFYRKFLIDLRQEQLKMEGSIPNFIPSMGSGGGAAIWGDAATIIPMTLTNMYDNSEELALYYPMMREWIEWNRRQIRTHKGSDADLLDFGFQFGDWLALDGVTPSSFKGGTDDAFLATVYYCHSLKLLSEAARLLGNKEDYVNYKALSNKVRQVILHEYFTPGGRLSIDTQAAYVVALKFDIYRNKKVLLDQFKNRLRKDLYQIKCGFAGAPLICQVLAENNMVELAYEFLLNEEFPSWLYAVNLGATTIWERWNSVMPDGTMNPAGMNSLNHYSYGSVMEFVTIL